MTASTAAESSPPAPGDVADDSTSANCVFDDIGGEEEQQDYSHVRIDDDVLNSAFVNEKSSDLLQRRQQPGLRVCCFGSSSKATPDAYIQEARHVGYILARRGHVCVNGAGSYGCMAALNDGACRGDGHIVGVIHEMWLVDSPAQETLRDGTFHKALLLGSGGMSKGSTGSAAGGGTNGAATANINEKNTPGNVKQSHGGPHAALTPSSSGGLAKDSTGTGGSVGELITAASGDGGGGDRQGPIRELLVAGGKDLQERKRLLVENADGLIVLPGGPGTFDELWEMACARNIGLSTLPIVCVNVNGYYDDFRNILERAWLDKLTKLQPEDILHFEDTAEAAVRWVEEAQAGRASNKIKLGKRSTPMLRRTSVMNVPVATGEYDAESWISNALRRSVSRASSWIFSDKDEGEEEKRRHGDSSSRGPDEPSSVRDGLLVGLGLAAGVFLTKMVLFAGNRNYLPRR